MNPRRSAAVISAMVALTVAAASAPGTAVTRQDDRRPTTTGDAVSREFLGRADDNTEPFLGLDGQMHQPAPFAVTGLRDEIFYGPDFDTACAIGGESSTSMLQATKLAKVIAKSGREVMWTAGPNKTTVLFRRLDPTQYPHGSCDEQGLQAQKRVIDNFPRLDPFFIPLRKQLSKDRRQVYFKTDPHWTTVGASVFTQAVATRLDPKLAARQSFTYGTESRVGLFNAVRGIDEPEVAQTAMPSGGVASRTTADSVEQWDGYPFTTLDYSWKSAPAKRTHRGRTLLLGDSFMLYALESMRPLFHKGRFMFIGHVSDRDVIRAIKQSDTVVFEILQTFVYFDSILTDPGFRAKLRRALR